MSTDPQFDSNQPPIIEFKSSSLTLPVLILRTNDLNLIKNQLEVKIAEAPSFFKHSPVILDLNNLRTQKLDIDLRGLITTARQLKLLPVGIRGGTENQKASALNMQIPTFSDFGFNIATAQKKQQPQTMSVETPAKQNTPVAATTKQINKPVRSGQRIYSAGDLIITAQVGAGSEIMAEGNIHVYGTLRGRALAGVKGNGDCRIFCTNLEAELVSIAGVYKTCEELESFPNNQAIQIALQDQTLAITII